MKEKQKALKPEIVKTETSLITKEELKDIAKELDKAVIPSEENEDADSFFRGIIQNLFSNENIELKTEYRNPQENFVGAKLDFLGQHTQNHLLSSFINVFERKRVSLERKSRIEIIKALQERREELERQQQEKMRNMLGF